MSKKFGFCWNSRIWIEFWPYDLPKTCPQISHEGEYDPDCGECSYYEMREPTTYLKRKRKALSGKEYKEAK